MLRDAGDSVFRPSGDCPTYARDAAVVFVFGLLSSAAIFLYAFAWNHEHLFAGLDGRYGQVLARQQFAWAGNALGFTGNLFQGLGNVGIPFNLTLVPAYFVAAFVGGGAVDPVVCYLVSSIQLFAAIFLFCCSLRLRPTVSLVGACALPLAIMPIVGLPFVYPIMSLAPNLSTAIAATVLMLVLLWQTGRGSRISTVACVLGVIFLIGYSSVTHPMWLMLMAPVVVVFGLTTLHAAESGRERRAKLIGAAIAVVATVASGAATFALGLVKYTATVTFAGELVNPRMGLDNASILFHWDGYSAVGPVLFALGVIGALIALACGPAAARAAAGSTLAGAAMVLVFGVLCATFDFWQGPVALYFEFFLWPMYAIFGAVALAAVVALCGAAVRLAVAAAGGGGAPAGNGRAIRLSELVSVLLLPGAVVGSVVTWMTMRGPGTELYPPAETPIIAQLRKEIGIAPGDRFRGRAATFTGLGIDRSVYWVDLHGNDAKLIGSFGNDHRLIGLWYYDIPTLTEYSQLITPPYYLVTRSFLARPGDRQMRTAMALRKPDPRMLRLLGVRFVVTDAPVLPDAALRVRLAGRDGAALFLYELDGANVGQYSPQHGVIAGDARAAMAAMSKPDFDPARSVVVEAALPERLVRLSASEIHLERGYMRISATSAGASVMVLPFEYSRCLELVSAGPGADAPTLFRANFLQAGILFTGRLDATLRLFTGPFRNSGCRLKDADDMRRLNIAATVGPPP